jgi:hypothetical protein
MFQVTNTNSPPNFFSLGQEANTNFGGFSTDVGFITNGSTLPSSPFLNGSGAPNTVDRSADGSTVVFTFVNPPGIIPGSTADVLVILTDATNFDSNGSLRLSFFLPDPPGFFEPAAVPLPSALPLFATGLVGLGLLGWRRKGKAAA